MVFFILNRPLTNPSIIASLHCEAECLPLSLQLASLLCKAGNNCSPCKHKAAISQIYNISEFGVLPESDQNIRGLDHYIADGVVCANSGYTDLNKPEHETDVNNFVETRTYKIVTLA